MIDETNDLKHRIIEAAKKSHIAFPGMPFVQHLEAAARDLCVPASDWVWSTGVRNGVWCLNLEPHIIAPDPQEQDLLA